MKTVARQKPLYENCAMYSPDGILLCKISKHKADWYLAKKLADIMQEDPLTIKLKFKPNGYGNFARPYFLQEFKNQCVACGTAENLSAHHVVPRCFRRHFPPEIKNHNSADVLALCIACHNYYETFAEKLKAELVPEFVKFPPEYKEKNKIKSLAKNLLYNTNLPEDRKVDLYIACAEYLGKEDLADADLIELADLKNPRFENKPYDKYVKGLKDIEGFSQMWRRHFVETMEPRYLPEGWVGLVLREDNPE